MNAVRSGACDTGRRGVSHTPIPNPAMPITNPGMPIPNPGAPNTNRMGAGIPENGRMRYAPTVQLVVATVLSMAGLVLLFGGFAFPPAGEIHNSVLIGFGEVATFAGALFGVDYRYKVAQSSR